MASVHFSSSSPIFDSTKNGSIDYMKKLPESFVPRSGLFSGPFPHTALPDGRRLCFRDVISEARDLSTSVKTKLNDFVNTVKDEQQIEDVAKDLKEFTTSMRLSTDQSLEQFARKASGLLTEINCQSQEYEKKMDKAKASGKLYSSLLSVIVGVCGALVRPLAGLAAVPFLPCFGLFWNLVRERPIEEKLNDLRAINFKIHSAILEAGKIKDAVYSLSNFFTDSSPYAQKVYVNFEDKIDKDLLSRYLSLESANNSIDFKAKGALDEERFKFQGSTSVSHSSGAFKEKGTIAGTSILLSCVMANNFKMKKAMEEEGASFHLVPFSEEVGDDGTTTTKRLWELGKEIMAASIAQVEMAEHELSQIIHSVISSLQEV